MAPTFGCGANTIKLRSGKYLDLKDPQPDQFDFEDIAGALAKICRFGAQCNEFYSVAELYLLRELGLQQIPVTYVNVIDGKITAASDDIYDIGSIEILDRELEQADRYLKE